MPYAELLEQTLLSLQRAQALESIEIVADLYEREIDDAARGLNALILHPDHWTGRVPSEVMEEINHRFGEAFPAVRS